MSDSSPALCVQSDPVTVPAIRYPRKFGKTIQYAIAGGRVDLDGVANAIEGWLMRHGAWGVCDVVRDLEERRSNAEMAHVGNRPSLLGLGAHYSASQLYDLRTWERDVRDAVRAAERDWLDAMATRMGCDVAGAGCNEQP